MPFYSPLRYPGGKRKLADFIELVILENGLADCLYVEPYAGGAAVALELLLEEYAARVWINDLDRAVFAFWKAAVEHTGELVERIRAASVTIAERETQKAVQEAPDASTVELGFSTFFLNRTNRSGIVEGGVIGGMAQTGKWKLDARFNKADLIARIQRIGRYRERIRVTCLDAAALLRTGLVDVQGETVLLYLDPPYYGKATGELYRNSYAPQDHAAVAEALRHVTYPWLVSYDNVDPVRELYADHEVLTYDVHYSAQQRYRGAEVMIFSHDLLVPEGVNPVAV